MTYRALGPWAVLTTAVQIEGIGVGADIATAVCVCRVEPHLTGFVLQIDHQRVQLGAVLAMFMNRGNSSRTLSP